MLKNARPTLGILILKINRFNSFTFFLFVACWFTLACAQAQTFTTRIDHVTIAVDDLDQAAKIFAAQDFTLKKPHLYSSGPQAGLKTQSIRLASGQYLQLVSLNKKGKKKGALAKWYAKQLKNTQGGATLVLEHSHPKELCQLYQKRNIACLFESHPGYDWMSFKTSGPFHPLAFIKYKKRPKIFKELIEHDNKVSRIKKLILSQQGSFEKWAEIMTLAEARGVGLEFSELGFKSGGVFIQEVHLAFEPDSLVVKKAKPHGLNRSFSLGKTIFTIKTL